MKYGMEHKYVIGSALILYAAVTISSCFFWGALLYLIPLFYGIMCNEGRVIWKEGAVWGIIFYGLHWYDVAILAHVHGQGIVRYAVMPFLVLYSASCAALWFLAASLLSSLSKRPAFAWIGITWLYVIGMQRISFWIFGRAQGYPFSFPLIPLAEYPSTLYILRFLHPHMLLLFLIAGSWFAAHAWRKKLWLPAGVAAASFYAPFVIGLFFIKQNNTVHDDPPARYYTLGYVSPATFSHTWLERAGELAQSCNALMRHNHQITHILTPESTLAIPLNTHPVLFDALAENVEDKTLTIIVGSQRKENDEYYNSCYFIHNRLIIRGYDKSCLMPFAEYIPNNWLNFEGINRIFLHNKIIMNANRKKGANLLFHDFLPMICSDYYLDWYDEPQETAVPLLLMVNETWFEGPTMRYLMQLTARYGALARRQDIIYVGYEEGLYLSRNGKVWPLVQ